MLVFIKADCVLKIFKISSKYIFLHIERYISALKLILVNSHTIFIYKKLFKKKQNKQSSVIKCLAIFTLYVHISSNKGMITLFIFTFIC